MIQKGIWMPYVVRVEENSHYDDEAGRWTVGTYEDRDVALQVAMRIVDEELTDFYEAGMTASDLYRQYTAFGHDAYIIGDDPQLRFSAWDYARKRCDQICLPAAQLE